MTTLQPQPSINTAKGSRIAGANSVGYTTKSSMVYKQALFIRFGGMGDILLATPSLRAVHQAFPGIQIDFIVGGGMTDVLADHPLVRRVITFDKRGVDSRVDHFVPFLYGLSRTKYDVVVNLHPSAKSVLMTAASRAKTTVSFNKDVTIDPATGSVTHAIDDFAKQLTALGIGGIQDRYLDFYVDPAAKKRVVGLVDARGRRVLVINAAASRPINRWPTDRFKALACHFAEQEDVLVVLTGAPRSFHTVFDDIDEISLASEITAVHPNILNLAGQLTVRELGALLAECDAFLTCDTGPMHVGSAVRAPMVVLSGAADPERTGPINPEATVLIDRSLPCVPCRQRTCIFGDVRCMKGISTNRVIDELAAKLGRGLDREHHGVQPAGV